jgi:DNA replication protein DnaC
MRAIGGTPPADLKVTPLPVDVDAVAAAEVAAEQTGIRLETYLKRRPPAFTKPGDQNAEIADWTARLLAGEAGNLVVAGNTGTGKTWSAWRIGEDLIRAGYRGRIEIMSAYRLKRLFAPPTDFPDLDRLAAADLLTVDDVGSLRVSQWDADLLGGLVDERSAATLPTILTVNPPDEDMPEGQSLLEVLLGDRVASRMAENVTVVLLAGDDRRRAS